MSASLASGIAQALGEHADQYDLEALTAALSAGGATDVDDIPEEEFWATVDTHALPDSPEPSALDRFKTEVGEAVQTEAGVPAVWRRGGVTLKIEGHSRVNMSMPQVSAVYRVTVAGRETVRLTPAQVFSWPRLWETVESYLDAWTGAVQERRQVYEEAVRAAGAARQAARQADAAAKRAYQDLTVLQPSGEDPVRHATMSRDEVAEYLGIAPGSVRRQMNRWGIEADAYERGASKSAEARYPAAVVQARAAARPGQGRRSDLR
ncbi:hypothetical protein [Streptomyces sp. NPDC059788]|uniref:hypothetical protein n=1 Tax=Streptomyces sp. NPDC059788 TaxID=3346948 RepID=UPI00364A31AC